MAMEWNGKYPTLICLVNDESSASAVMTIPQLDYYPQMHMYLCMFNCDHQPIITCAAGHMLIGCNWLINYSAVLRCYCWFPGGEPGRRRPPRHLLSNIRTRQSKRHQKCRFIHNPASGRILRTSERLFPNEQTGGLNITSVYWNFCWYKNREQGRWKAHYWWMYFFLSLSLSLSLSLNIFNWNNNNSKNKRQKFGLFINLNRTSPWFPWSIFTMWKWLSIFIYSGRLYLSELTVGSLIAFNPF